MGVLAHSVMTYECARAPARRALAKGLRLWFDFLGRDWRTAFK